MTPDHKLFPAYILLFLCMWDIPTCTKTVCPHCTRHHLHILHDVHLSGLYSTINYPFTDSTLIGFSSTTFNILISSRLLAIIIKIGTLSRQKSINKHNPKELRLNFKPKDWYTVYMIPLAQNSIIVAMSYTQAYLVFIRK